MNIEEIKREYKLFLEDTNKKDNKKTFEEFKKDFATWYVELFGINDERTTNILNILNSLQRGF